MTGKRFLTRDQAHALLSTAGGPYRAPLASALLAWRPGLSEDGVEDLVIELFSWYRDLAPELKRGAPAPSLEAVEDDEPADDDVEPDEDEPIEDEWLIPERRAEDVSSLDTTSTPEREPETEEAAVAPKTLTDDERARVRELVVEGLRATPPLAPREIRALLAEEGITIGRTNLDNYLKRARKRLQEGKAPAAKEPTRPKTPTTTATPAVPVRTARTEIKASTGPAQPPGRVEPAPTLAGVNLAPTAGGRFRVRIELELPGPAAAVVAQAAVDAMCRAEAA